MAELVNLRNSSNQLLTRAKSVGRTPECAARGATRKGKRKSLGDITNLVPPHALDMAVNSAKLHYVERVAAGRTSIW